MNSLQTNSLNLFNDIFINSLIAFQPKNPKFQHSIYNRLLSLSIIEQKYEHQHCLLNVLYYFYQLKNSQLDYNNFIIDFINNSTSNPFILQSNSSIINQTSNFDKEQILQGQIKNLIKTILFDHKIQIGVFVYNSKQHLHSNQIYQLIVYNNHIFLTSKELLDKEISYQNIKKQYKIFPSAYNGFKNYYQNNQSNQKLIQKTTKFGNIQYQQRSKGQIIHNIQDSNIEDQIIIEDQKYKKQLIKNLYFDIETYIISNYLLEESQQNRGKQAAYLICITDDDNNQQYYKGIDCIDNFINNFIPQLQNQNDEFHYYIWSFNGGKFDYLFFIDQLIVKYKQLNIIGTQTNIKQIQIDNIYFKDIYQIFSQGSLKSQCKSWGLDEQYWKQDNFDIKGWSLEKYQNEQEFEKVLHYCFQDCRALKGLVNKFFDITNDFIDQMNSIKVQRNNDIIVKQFNLDYSHIFSTTQLTLKLFTQFFLKDVIQSSISKDVYNIERNSYYGGMTINIKRQGSNLNYYDINSSYPNIMKNEEIPCYAYNRDNSEIITYVNPKYIRDYIDQNFNYIYQKHSHTFINYNLYEVEIQYRSNIKIPFTPIRTKEGLLYPLHIEKSWRWGKEINFLIQKNLLVRLILFQEIKYIGKKIFKEYIEKLFQLRIEAKQNQRSDLDKYYKLLMNGLYGKFGQRVFNKNFFVDNDIKMEYLQNPLLQNIKQISDNSYKIELAPTSDLNFIGSLVRISSYITMSARVNLMSHVHGELGEESIYYMDTDSIITDKQLPQQYIGEQLGQWKLEEVIKEGLFLAPKIYTFQNDQGQITNKAKGVKKENLSYEFYQQLLTKQQVKIKNKDVFQRQPNCIFIEDQEKNITIKDNKRIYDHNLNTSFPFQNIYDFEKKQYENKNNFNYLQNII